MDTYYPASLDDILQVLANSETNAKLCIIISYWEIGASFVNHGAIDEQMYNESSTKQFLVYA